MKVVANRWRYDYFPFALFAIKALFLLVRTMYCKSTFDLVRRHFKKFTKSRPRDFMLLYYQVGKLRYLYFMVNQGYSLEVGFRLNQIVDCSTVRVQ